jgi:hypothetical protein
MSVLALLLFGLPIKRALVLTQSHASWSYMCEKTQDANKYGFVSHIYGRKESPNGVLVSKLTEPPGVT